MGIRGDSVLVPGRPFQWIDAEVVIIIKAAQPRTKSRGRGLHSRPAGPAGAGPESCRRQGR